MKKSVDKNIKKSNSKLEKDSNVLDNYISKNLSKNIWWNNKNNSTNKDSETLEFLENDVKITKILPKKMVKSKELPNNLGYFESSFGTMSVGYKKYNKNSDIAFTLIPEKTRKQENIPLNKQNSPNTYFDKELKGQKKKFKIDEK